MPTIQELADVPELANKTIAKVEVYTDAVLVTLDNGAMPFLILLMACVCRLAANHPTTCPYPSAYIQAIFLIPATCLMWPYVDRRGR
jgi:hypothetical protein